MGLRTFLRNRIGRGTDEDDEEDEEESHPDVWRDYEYTKRLEPFLVTLPDGTEFYTTRFTENENHVEFVRNVFTNRIHRNPDPQPEIRTEEVRLVNYTDGPITIESPDDHGILIARVTGERKYTYRTYDMFKDEYKSTSEFRNLNLELEEEFHESLEPKTLSDGP